MGRGSKQTKSSTVNSADGTRPALKTDADGNEAVERIASSATRRQQKTLHAHLLASSNNNDVIQDDSVSSRREEAPSPLTLSSEPSLISANHPRLKTGNKPLGADAVVDDEQKLQSKSRGTSSPSSKLLTSTSNSADHDTSNKRRMPPTNKHTDGVMDSGTTAAEDHGNCNGNAAKRPSQVADSLQQHCSHHHRPLEHAKGNGLKESDDEISECPLCMEVMDVDDLAFYPCTVCAYQICRFCWHRIIHESDATGETQCTVVGGAFCPNCRSPYDEQATLRATQRRIQLRQQQQAISNASAAAGKAANSRVKQQQTGKSMPKQSNFAKNVVSNVNFPSLSSTTSSNGISSAPLGPHQRQPSINCRVVLKNLLFVQGVPVVLGHFGERWVRNLFERFGHVEKVIFTHTNSSSGDAAPTIVMSSSAGAPGDAATATIKGVKGDTCGAFITYINYEHALESLVALNNYSFRLNETDLQDIVGTAKSRNAAPLKPWTPKERKDLCDKTYQMRVFLGTSKYCQNYLNGKPCMRRPEVVAAMAKQNNRGKRSAQTVQLPSNIEICHYMHDSGDLDAIFTKEEITIGMHLRYQQRLINHYLSRKRLRAAAAVAGSSGASSAALSKPSGTVPTTASAAASNAEASATANRVFEQQQQTNVRVPVGMPAAAVLAAQAAAAAASAAAAVSKATAGSTVQSAKSSSSKCAAPPTAWAHPTLSVSKLFNTGHSNSSKVTLIKQPAPSIVSSAAVISDGSLAAAKIRSKASGTAAGGAWGGDNALAAANINNLEEFPPVIANSIGTIPNAAERNSALTTTAMPIAPILNQQQQVRPSSSNVANKPPVESTKTTKISDAESEATSNATTPASSRPVSSSKRSQQPVISTSSNTGICITGSNMSSHRGSTASIISTANNNESAVSSSAGSSAKAAVAKKNVNINKIVQPRVATPSSTAPVTPPTVSSNTADAQQQQQKSSQWTPKAAIPPLSQVIGRDSGCCSSASAESPLPVGTGGTVAASATGRAARRGPTADNDTRSESTLSSTSSSLSSLFPPATVAVSMPSQSTTVSGSTLPTSNTPTSGGSSVFADHGNEGSASVPPVMIASSSVSAAQHQQQQLFPLQVAASAAYNAFLSPHHSDSFVGSGGSGPITINSNTAFGVRTVSSSVGTGGQLSSSQQQQQHSPLFVDCLSAVATTATGTAMPQMGGLPLFEQHQATGTVYAASHPGFAETNSQHYHQQINPYRTSFAEDTSVSATQTGFANSMLKSDTDSGRRLDEPRGSISSDRQSALAALLCRSLNINASNNGSRQQFRQNAQPQQQQHQRLLSTSDTVVPLDYCDVQSIEQYVQQQQQQRQQQQLLSQASSASTPTSLSTMMNNTPPPLFASNNLATGGGSTGETVGGGGNSMNLTALSSSQMTPPWSIAPTHTNTGPSPGLHPLKNMHVDSSVSDKNDAAQNTNSNNVIFPQNLLYAGYNLDTTNSAIPNDEYQRHQWLLRQHQQEQEQQRLLFLARQQQQSSSVQPPVARHSTSFTTTSYASSSLFNRGDHGHAAHSSLMPQYQTAAGTSSNEPIDAGVFGNSSSPHVSVSSQQAVMRSSYLYDDTHTVSATRQVVVTSDDALDGELGFDPWAVSHDALSSMIGAAAVPTTAGHDSFDGDSSVNKLASQATSSPLLDFMSMRCNYHQMGRQQRTQLGVDDSNDADDDDDYHGYNGRNANNAENTDGGGESMDAAALLALPRQDINSYSSGMF